MNTLVTFSFNVAVLVAIVAVYKTFKNSIDNLLTKVTGIEDSDASEIQKAYRSLSDDEATLFKSSLQKEIKHAVINLAIVITCAVTISSII